VRAAGDHRAPGPLSSGGLIRLLADALLVNAALFTASIIRSLVVFQHPASTRATMVDVLSTYGMAAIITPVALFIFYRSGFYTYGRGYRSRYKALVVLRAVTLSYLILGFLVYSRLIPGIPRGMIIGGWILTAVFVGGARLFARTWSEIVRREDRLARIRPDGQVRRVLVVGGAGYVGAALVRQLLSQGCIVRVLDVLLYGDQAMAELRAHPRFEFVRGDFRHVESVVRSMQDVDAVVHLGAIVGDQAGDIEPDVTQEINVAATRLVAEIARGYGVRRFIFTSTCSVYGASDQILDERSALNAVSFYAKSKLASEEILLGMANECFSPVVLRLGTLYGLSYRKRFDLVVNLLSAKAAFEKSIMIMDGDQWRPFVHVEDAARAIVLCLRAPATVVGGQIFNVGGTEENYKFRDIAAMICELIPGTKVTYVENDGPRRNYRVSCDKIRGRVGFKLKRNVRHGILEIREAIETGEVRDYSASEYSNFKFLAESGASLSKAMPESVAAPV
jgi:nucleoside-diphosphate-sugar epimerase